MAAFSIETFYRDKKNGLMIQMVRTLIIAAALLSVTGCMRLHLVAEYDKAISDEINTVAQKIDLFYLTMLEKSSNENDGRLYQKYVDKYIEIEAELNSLYQKISVKPLNTDCAAVCRITCSKWVKYKNEHKKENSLPNGNIKINRIYMRDHLHALKVAEEAKRIALAEQPEEE